MSKLSNSNVSKESLSLACRYLSCMAEELSEMVSEACFSARAAFCSPSAAITCGRRGIETLEKLELAKAFASHTTIFYIKRTKKVRFGGSVEQVSESAWKYFIWISTLMMLRSVRIDSRTHSKWSNELFLQQWQDFFGERSSPDC